MTALFQALAGRASRRASSVLPRWRSVSHLMPRPDSWPRILQVVSWESKTSRPGSLPVAVFQ